MKFVEFDTVILLKDFPCDGLRKGDIGVVIAVYAIPTVAQKTFFSNELELDLKRERKVLR